MKDFKTWQNIITSLTISVVPTGVIAIVDALFKKFQFNRTSIFFIIATYMLSAIFSFVIIKNIENIPCFRKYHKFEGIWIEIIEDDELKPISICKLDFDRDGYHFNGSNYSRNGDKPVRFRSIKFIANDDDGFFFVTSSNQKYRPEGFAKVYSLSKAEGGFYEGNGFFFDVASSTETKVKYMRLIKFDKNFCRNEMHLSKAINIKKLTSREIYDNVLKYVKNEHDTDS